MITKQSILNKIWSLKNELEETEEALNKDWDEEVDRLQYVEKDFSPHDGVTTYYTMIKLIHAPDIAQGTRLEDYWTFNVSDGWTRTGGSATTLEEAIERTLMLAQENLETNIKNDWRLNKQE